MLQRGEGTRRRRGSIGAAIALFASALVFTVGQPITPVSPVDAAGETIISTFYVPIFEDNAQDALFSVNGGTGTALSSTTSITIGAEGAILYYDHWEDAYEATPNIRVQASTLVFGDGDVTNGNAATYCVPARCAGDLLPAGAVLRLNNSATVVPGSINTPRSAATVVFDGRDKISSTDGLAVTHATWPTAIDALHSEMAAAFDTSRWGVNFRAPVGVNTPAQGSGVQSFTYTGVEVMAREAGTLVQIDINNDGDFIDAGDINQTIGEGETVFVNGGVLQGTRIVSSKPTQVFLMTGVIGSNYENRSFQVFPTEGLVNDYVAPASTARADGTYATVLYLFNPQAATITVTVTTPSGSTNYNIPAGQILNPAPFLANNEAARVTSTATFAAVAGSGTREVLANSKNYDWGYSLLPARVITDSLVVGWAPGSQDLTVDDYDPVWVTTLANTTLFVDYDADPTTGANTDPNGSRYDVAIAATALTQLRITDSGDNDMTGARLYTVDGTGVAAAYGEDPAAATPVAFPGVDLGTTLFPACGALCVRKLATISVDVDGDGLADPGDTLLWSVEATNTDYYALVNPILFDTLPAGVAYVPGSTSIIINADPPVAVADDVVPPAATLYPYDEGGRQLTANVPVGGVVTATFETIIDENYAGDDAICNRAIVTSQRELILTPANGADTGCIPVDNLRITKVSNSGGNPVLPGQALQYTVVVTNNGSSTLTNLAVTDPLPAGLTWNSTSVTRPANTTTTFADNFEVVADWTGSTGGTAWSDASWTEIDSQTAPPSLTTGRVRKVTDSGDQSMRISNGRVGDGISRVIGNLTSATTATLTYQWRCSSVDAGESVVAQVRANASSPWQTLATYSACGTTTYAGASINLAAGQRGSATEIRFVVSADFDQNNDQFFVDDVQISTNPRVSAVVAGAAPPNLVTLVDLLPGESATIVINTTVNDPYTATDEITNIATVRSDNQVAKADVTDCVRCFDFGDDPSTYNGAGGTNPARARATSVRALIADTFQNLGYDGSTGTQDWAGTSWVETDASGGGATGGLVQNVIDASTRSIRIGSAAGSTATSNELRRLVGDLSGFTTVNIGFEYRCTGFETTGDEVQLQIRPIAGVGAWQLVQAFTAPSCTNPSVYSGADVLIAPANYGTSTEIRLAVTSALEANEFLFFDDVQIRAVADGTDIGPRLGTLFDREVQGAGGASPFPATPPAAPTGDDSTGIDDEDGVGVPAVDVNTMEIPITVTDTSGGISYVNGWLDWSNNGAFESGESIFTGGTFVSATGGLTVVSGTGQVPGPGTYTVTINVPNLETNGSGYAIGDTVYTRFRVATARADVANAVGVSTDGEIEDYSTTLNTLPVSLAYLGTQRVGGDVVVSWRTAQEVDNLGFNLYAEGAGGLLTLLTPELILSKAPTSIEAQEYTVTVTTAAGTIWLEDISLDGVTELHGPFTVGDTVGDPNPPAPIDWTQAQAEVDRTQAAERRAEQMRARAESRQRLNSSGNPATGPVAQLHVTESGVQEVTYADLLATGVDLAGVPAASLAVTDRSGPVQIDIVGGDTFGPGSAIRFIGEPLDTLYTDTNVYRVHIDPTLASRVDEYDPNAPAPTTTSSTTTPPVRPPSTPPRRIEGGPDMRPSRTTTTTTAPETTVATTTTVPGPVVPVTQYTATATSEQNLSYSLTAPGDDPWYEQMLIAFAGTPAAGNTSISLDQPDAAATGTASVELWGITRDAIADEHHVRLLVNGVEVADAFFDDNDALRLQGTVPAGVLVDGVNTLQVELLADTGVSIDLVAIDSWQVTYQRATTAIDGRLDLVTSGNRVDIGGLPAGDAYAYRIGDDGLVTKLATVPDGGVLQVPGAGVAQRYVVAAADAVHAPLVAPLAAVPDLLTGTADYLVITNSVFSPSLAPLVAYHQSQGRTVKVVELDDVYQAFSHGVVDAEAIDAFVAAAVPALGVQWVLLVGADSVDYRDYDDDGSFSLMPSLYGSTGFSVTFAPIDPAYADVDGDGVPDVALGRMPARTPSELDTMIAKTLAYATQQTTQTVLLVSDTADGIDFAAANDSVATGFDDWTVRRSDIDRQGFDDARAELLAAIDDGVALTFYLGHSGSQEWTGLGLFDATTAAGLSNETPTIVVQFGCWNTYYVAPDADTMAHALLLNADGGAAAVLGSSTLTSAGSDVHLAQLLAGQLGGGSLTIGEAVLLAKQQLHESASGSTADVQLGWTILGDPAIPAGGNG